MMTINTLSVQAMKRSLLKVFEIPDKQLDEIINTYNEEQIQKFICYNIRNHINNIQFYHFTRKLNDTDYHELLPLRELLIVNNSLLNFLTAHDISFAQNNDGSFRMLYKSNEINLERTANTCDRQHLPFVQRLINRLDNPHGRFADPFINGFLFDNPSNGDIEYYLSCPEFVQDIDHVLSKIIGFDDINLKESFIMSSTPFSALCIVPIGDLYFGCGRKKIAEIDYLDLIFRALKGQLSSEPVYFNNLGNHVQVFKWIPKAKDKR